MGDFNHNSNARLYRRVLSFNPEFILSVENLSNIVVNDNTAKKKGGSTTGGSSNTNKVLGGVGASLVAIGTTTLLLNSNPDNYKVELKGDPIVSINLYEDYVDQGCTVYEDDQELELNSVVSLANEKYIEVERKNRNIVDSNRLRAIAIFNIVTELQTIKGDKENIKEKNNKKIKNLINMLDSLALPI